MKITHKIKMDLLDKQPFLAPVDAVQNDSNTRVIEMTLYEGDVPWNVPDGVTAALAFVKPDGTRGLYDELPDGTAAVSIAENVVTVVLAPQVLTSAGHVKASILMNDAALNQLSSFPFSICVSPNPGAGAVASNNYYYYTTLDGVNKAIGDLSELKTTEKSNLVAAINEAAESGGGAGGQPVPVSVSAEMTDTATIYLYMGDEDGWQNGAWYYWSGSAWTVGSAYGIGLQGPQGEKGDTGPQGEQGPQGEPGEADPEQVQQLVEEYLAENPAQGGAGLTTAQIDALDGLFKIAAYTEDASGAYAAFKSAFGLSDNGSEEPDEPDVPVVKTYTISAELVNVTSSNAATSVNENASYTATLTVAEGYNLDSVTVTMGGVDVTADVYADGVITIAAVTGNVGIVASASVAASEAELLTDGLLGYWDLRNPAEVVTQSWHWAYPPNEGNGGLYASTAGGSEGTASLPTSNEYGITGIDFHVEADSTTYPSEANASSMGNEFTVIVLSYGAAFGMKNNASRLGVVGTNVDPRWGFSTAYQNASGSTVITTAPGQISNNNDSAGDYNFFATTINGSNKKVIMDTSYAIFNGEDYDDFASWFDKIGVSTAWAAGYVVAFAVYNRALTDVEIEEMRAFMKTLEVTA